MSCNFECEACKTSHMDTEYHRYHVTEFTDDILRGLEQALVREIPCVRENWGNVAGEPLVELKRIADTPDSVSVAFSVKHLHAVEIRRMAYFEGRKRT